MAEQSPWIIDVTEATFQTEVFERSRTTPVVVDFWATWCQPCRQLVPLLEQLTNEYAGRFILAKVNVDECPQIAGAFGVQSIPTVVALVDGQPADHFMGLLPEHDLRAWIDGLLPSPVDMLVQEGLALKDADPQQAELKFREAADLDPENALIQIQLADILLDQNRLSECGDILTKLQQRGWLEPEAERLKSEWELKQAAFETGGVEPARQRVAENPDDLTLQVQLADALAAAGQHQEALEICLTVIEQDRDGVGVEAKETMVNIFDTLGPGSELTGSYRRRLATLLY